MRGKTAWETGQILGVSEATVAFYLRNARSKLGCKCKHQAVLRALSLGLIHQAKHLWAELPPHAALAHR